MSALIGAFPSFSGWKMHSSSPPWYFTMAASRFKASFDETASSAIFLQASRVPFPARKSISVAKDRQTSVRSAGPSPFKVLTASSTSRELPIWLPRGISILVIKAAVFRPFLVPMATIFSASFMESSTVFIKAPLPVFTSSKMQSLPAASFLLIIEDAISGMLSTVPVTSRRA